MKVLLGEKRISYYKTCKCSGMFGNFCCRFCNMMEKHNIHTWDIKDDWVYRVEEYIGKGPISGKRRTPDGLWVDSDGKYQLIVEVHHTNPLQKDRKDDYRAMGIPYVEVSTKQIDDIENAKDLGVHVSNYVKYKCATCQQEQQEFRELLKEAEIEEAEERTLKEAEQREIRALKEAERVLREEEYREKMKRTWEDATVRKRPCRWEEMLTPETGHETGVSGLDEKGIPYHHTPNFIRHGTTCLPAVKRRGLGFESGRCCIRCSSTVDEDWKKWCRSCYNIIRCSEPIIIEGRRAGMDYYYNFKLSGLGLYEGTLFLAGRL